jgi:predicted histidine transporter YuiF (NhaC family)
MVDYMLAEDAECYLDGYNMLEAKPRACETVEVKTGLAVVIALSVVIIFVALVAAVAIVYRKKRHYEQEYQRLANNKAESDDIEL